MTPSEEKALISSSSSSWGREFCCLARCSNGLLTAGVRVLSGNRRKELKVFYIKNVKVYLPWGNWSPSSFQSQCSEMFREQIKSSNGMKSKELNHGKPGTEHLSRKSVIELF